MNRHGNRSLRVESLEDRRVFAIGALTALGVGLQSTFITETDGDTAQVSTAGALSPDDSGATETRGQCLNTDTDGDSSSYRWNCEDDSDGDK